MKNSISVTCADAIFADVKNNLNINTEQPLDREKANKNLTSNIKYDNTQNKQQQF